MSSPTIAITQNETGKSSKGKTTKTEDQKHAATLVDAAEKTTRQEQEKGETELLVNTLLVAESQIITRTVASLIDYVMFIVDARAQLKGKSISRLQFDPWAEFQRRSKGGPTQISMCLSIAKRSALLDPENFAKLPVSLIALYYIASNMSGSEISTRIKDGTINMDLTVEQTKTLVGKGTKTSKKVKAATKKAVAAAKKETKAKAETERLRLEREVAKAKETAFQAERERQAAAAGTANAGAPAIPSVNETVAEVFAAPGTAVPRLADQTPTQIFSAVRPDWIAYKYDLSNSSELDNFNFRSDLTGLPADDLNIVNAEYTNIKRALPVYPHKTWVLILADERDISPMTATTV